jgi:hypothetical protein
MNKGGAPDQGGSGSVERDSDLVWSVRDWDLPNILPLDLNLILNSQFNSKLNTHFIIDQYI